MEVQSCLQKPSARKNMTSKEWSRWDESTHGTITVFILTITIFWYAWVVKKSRVTASSLPPGPRGLPLVGNLPFLKPDVHHHFAELARTYGPIMKLQLGCKLCVVVSSPSVAKQVMKDNDAIFANRYVNVAAKAFFYNATDILWSPYGAEWRMLRKVWSSELMCNTVLKSYYDLRRSETRRMVSNIYAMIGTPICVRKKMFISVLNVVMGMLWGGTLEGEEKTSVAARFLHLVESSEEQLGKTNLSDLFPCMAWFDLQGVERSLKRNLSLVDQIFDYVMDQRLKMDRVEGEEKEKKKESKDLLQLLLQLMEERDPKMQLSMTQVKGLLLDMVAGATDTTSSAVEWAMAEMMQHPEVMRMVQEELDQVVGINTIVEESHLPRLCYLDAVVKEVLRLHPVAPLLAPRSPSQSCTIGDYMIPKGTQIMINAWAIHRDPEIWVNPSEFQPERFLNGHSEYNYHGNDLRYIPFGSGRRICAGIPLAEKMVMHVLASLLHSFMWRLPEGIKLNLVEKFGITLKKATLLVAIPTPRLSNADLYD